MPENDLFSSNQEEPEGNFGYGILLTFGLHTTFAGIWFILWLIRSAAWNDGNLTLLIPLLLIGITQCIYMIPAIVIVNAKGKSHLVKGLLIGAGITFLLNAACTGVRAIISFP